MLGGSMMAPYAKRKKTPGKRGHVITNLFRAQKGRCYICCGRMTLERGKPNTATKDHVIPRYHGGSDRQRNLAAACSRCNHERGHDWDAATFSEKRAKALALGRAKSKATQPRQQSA
jgi:5-methylcytosine-specific restriction endonuclease McrA